MKPLLVVIGLAAAGLLAAGLLLGFGRTVFDESGQDCGTAFRENPDLLSDRYGEMLRGRSFEDGCAQERSDAKQLPIVLLVLGGATLGGVGITLVAARNAQPGPGSALPSA